MNTSAATYWVVLVALLAAVYGTFTLWRTRQPADEMAGTSAARPPAVASAPDSRAMPAGPVAPFKLTDQDGNEFDSETLNGKVWVASFFFTNCPAICWRMNQALSAWQQTHPDSQIHFVSITCDPENDTPAALKKYAEHFKADPKRWTFLTGDMKDIQRIGQDSFKVAVVQGDHTDRACVVDSSGKVRGRFRLTEPDQAEMLDRLLTVVEAEPVAPPTKPTSASDVPPQSEGTVPPTKPVDESGQAGDPKL
jgi:cytochrome oxidase Cu insertion factor (SCO1/SenC/PrrC family)